jgi:hypothetical protein
VHSPAGFSKIRVLFTDRRAKAQQLLATEDMTKALIGFTGYTGANLFPIAANINSQLVEHAALFPDLPSPAAGFEALIAARRFFLHTARWVQ